MNFPTNSEKSTYASFFKSILILVFCLSVQIAFGQEEAEILTAEISVMHPEESGSYLARLNPEKDTEEAKAKTPAVQKVLLNSEASKGILNLAIFEIPAEFSSMEIVDTRGKTVERIRIPDERNAFLNLDVSMMKNGLYKLRIANNEQIFSEREFILQK